MKYIYGHCQVYVQGLRAGRQGGKRWRELLANLILQVTKSGESPSDTGDFPPAEAIDILPSWRKKRKQQQVRQKKVVWLLNETGLSSEEPGSRCARLWSLPGPRQPGDHITLFGCRSPWLALLPTQVQPTTTTTPLTIQP